MIHIYKLYLFVFLFQDDLKNLFAGAGSVQRVKILPPRDDRDVTLA